jgi:hypothetical protein
MTSKKSGIEESYNVNLKSFSPSMKVQLVLRLEEKRAEIEGRKCTGLSRDEIAEALGKYNLGLSQKQLDNAIKMCYMWGTVIPGMRKIKEEYETVYRIEPCKYQLLDALLKRIGWVEERIKI